MTTRSTQRIAMALAAGTLLVAGLSACVPLVVGGAAAVGVGMMATDRRSSGAQVDDQGIELRGGARIREIANDNMYVSITSFNRQVLLTGSVGTQADRVKVEDVVRRVDNVRSVVNELTVGPPASFQDRSNDTYISGKVKASLLDAKDVFANSFKVVTERGTVYMMGIATRRETDRATDIARGVSGVTKVVRVVEIVSESDLANIQSQQQQQSTQGGATQGGTGASSTSRVPLPPMEPLPSSPAPGGSGVTTSPVR
jgi:osmotically-inducible protein OsmY